MPAVVLCVAATYYYVSFAHLIDARLHGERDRVLPRVFARPLELRRGQSLTERQLVDRLNDLGYAQRARPEKPGEFAIGDGAVAIMPRSADLKGQIVRVVFQRPPAAKPRREAGRETGASRPPRTPDRVERLELGNKPSERLMLDAPVLTSLVGGEREKRRPVALVGDSGADGAGGARDRGSPLLRAPGRRSDRHCRRACSRMRGHARVSRPAPARSRSRWRATCSCRRSKA